MNDNLVSERHCEVFAGQNEKMSEVAQPRSNQLVLRAVAQHLVVAIEKSLRSVNCKSSRQVKHSKKNYNIYFDVGSIPRCCRVRW